MQWLMRLGEQIQDGTVILYCNDAFTTMMHVDERILKQKKLHDFNDDTAQQELY